MNPWMPARIHEFERPRRLWPWCRISLYSWRQDPVLVRPTRQCG